MLLQIRTSYKFFFFFFFNTLKPLYIIINIAFKLQPSLISVNIYTRQLRSLINASYYTFGMYGLDDFLPLNSLYLFLVFSFYHFLITFNDQKDRKNCRLGRSRSIEDNFRRLSKAPRFSFPSSFFNLFRRESTSSGYIRKNDMSYCTWSRDFAFLSLLFRRSL